MGSIASSFATVYRDFVTNGVPASGDHEPVKSDIRALGGLIEGALSVLSLGSVSVVYSTRAELNADLAHGPASVALVYADATDANNDLYVKTGSSGSGAWTRTNILHVAIGFLAEPYRARAANAVPFATWATLAATTGMVALDRATVLASDTGTHTDPVAGGTVLNSGVYEYSASPAGWRRVADLDSQTAAAVAATIAAERALLAVLAAQFNLSGYIVSTYGALSRAQTGAGIATAATSITAGNTAGHWQLSGGRLFRTATGVSAGMGEGAYLLTLNNGDKHAIMMEANAWDVATQAEWDFVAFQAASNLAGKKIGLRNETLIDTKATGNTGSAFRRVELRNSGIPLTIEGRFGAARDWASYCQINGATMRGVRGITWRHLRTLADATTKFGLVGETANLVDDIVIEDCHISGQVADPFGDYAISSNYPNFNIDLITSAGSAAGTVRRVTIRNCLIEWGRNNVNVSVGGAGAAFVFTGNEIRFFYEDACKNPSVGAPVTITDNFFHSPMGLPGDSLGQHPDAIQFIGSRFASADWSGIYIARNVILGATTSRGLMQAILLDDMKTSAGDSGFFFTATIEDNLISNNVSQGIWVNQARNVVVRRNTVIAWGQQAVNTTSILVGSGSLNATDGGGNTIQSNIADGGVTGGANGNFLAGRNGATIPYANLFDGPFNPTTRADAIRFFRPRVSAGARLSV